MDINTPFAQITFAAPPAQAQQFLDTASQYLAHIEALDHVAQLQNSIKHYEGSVTTLERMLRLTTDPNAVAAIRSNMATVLNRLNEPRRALEQLDHLSAFGTQPSVEMERSLSHYFLGEYHKTREIMTQLLEHELPDPARDRIVYNLAIFRLEDGDFDGGYYDYIHRGHRINIWPTQRRAMVPDWDGEITPGRTILIHGEGGIGDEIIGVRFAQEINRRGMRAVWHTNNRHLASVFERNGVETVTDYADVEGEDVAQVMAMYLPHLLKIAQPDLGVYLTPCEKHVEKWRELLPEGPKLAVRWAGNTGYDQDLHRSIPVEHLRELEWNGHKISLQIDQQVDWAFNPEINSIEDTLAIISLCDCTVTSCTSVAHMAGAMGAPTVVCPPIAYYYVWARGHRWYGDHVDVIRQTEWRDWAGVFEQVQKRMNE